MLLQPCLPHAAAVKGVARADKTKYCQLRAPPPDLHQFRYNTFMSYGDRKALQQYGALSHKVHANGAAVGGVSHNARLC